MSRSLSVAFRNPSIRKVAQLQYDDAEVEQIQNELTEEANMLKEEVRSLFDSGHIISSDQMGEYEGRAQNIFNRAAEKNVEIDGFKNAKDIIEQATSPKDSQTKMQENAEKQNPLAVGGGASIMLALAAQFNQDNAPSAAISGGEAMGGYMPNYSPNMPSATRAPQIISINRDDEKEIPFLETPFLSFSGAANGYMPEGMGAALKAMQIVHRSPSLTAMRA
jgi:hypothetical protein